MATQTLVSAGAEELWSKLGTIDLIGAIGYLTEQSARMQISAQSLGISGLDFWLAAKVDCREPVEFLPQRGGIAAGTQGQMAVFPVRPPACNV